MAKSHYTSFDSISFREIEAEAERKIDKLRKRIQEETDLSQQMRSRFNSINDFRG